MILNQAVLCHAMFACSMQICTVNLVNYKLSQSTTFHFLYQMHALKDKVVHANL